VKLGVEGVHTIKFLADSPLVPALVMFIETLKVRIKKWLLKL